MANFVGLLLQRGTRGVTSSTVKEEADRQLVSTVNNLVDRAISRRRYQFRRAIMAKCRGRLKDLWDRLDIRTLKCDATAVKMFYQALLKDPPSKAKLEKLKKNKGRKGLMPEDSDMSILSEAMTLKSNNADLHFISKDGDFTCFANEIENRFGVKILAVQDLIQFTIKLESSGSQV